MRRKVTDSTAGSIGKIIGGVIALIFGVIWTVTVTAMGAPTFFGLFGVLFCCAAIGGILLGLYNASAAPKDRIGAIEIVDLEDSVHCKHCGKSISDDSKFCRHCGGKQ